MPGRELGRAGAGGKVQGTGRCGREGAFCWGSFPRGAFHCEGLTGSGGPRLQVVSQDQALTVLGSPGYVHNK